MNPETNDERGVEFLKKRASLVVFRKRYECFLDNLLLKILNYPLCLMNPETNDKRVVEVLKKRAFTYGF